MNRQEAIKVLKEDRYLYESDIVSAGDGSPEGDLLLAIDMAVAALEKQIEIEKAQFTHICKSDNDYYPTTFSIYARIVDEDDKSVTLDRFQKFGALPLKSITISKEDFCRYYKPIKGGVADEQYGN